MSYPVIGSWSGNFQAEVTVTNSGSSTLNGWTVTWAYGGDQRIYNSWGAEISHSRTPVTATNAGHNATLASDQSTGIGIGIQGTVSGASGPPDRLHHLTGFPASSYPGPDPSGPG